LYSEEDQPCVEIAGDATVSGDFEACDRTDSVRKWQIPKGDRVVEGVLRCEDVAARVAWRIFRATVTDEHGELPVEVEKEELRSEAVLRVHGLPHIDARLLANSGDEQAEIPLLERFNALAITKIKSSTLYEALRNRKLPIAAISIWDGENWIKTPARVYEFSQMDRWLFDPKRKTDPPWLNLMGQRERKTFDEVVELPKQSGTSALYELPPDDVTPLYQWARAISAQSWVFSKKTATEETWPLVKEYALSNQKATFQWVHDAEAVISGSMQCNVTGETLIESYSGLSWMPIWQRWKEYILYLRSRLASDVELVPLINEWSRDVKSLFLTDYGSQIANLPGGRKLTHAFVLNLMGNNNAIGAFNQLESISNQPPGIVNDLRELLRGLLLLKANQFQELRSDPPIACHKRLRMYFVALSSNSVSISAPTSSNHKASVLPPDVLPLPPDDINRLRGLLNKASCY
jgi:hypothetical protein